VKELQVRNRWKGASISSAQLCLDWLPPILNPTLCHYARGRYRLCCWPRKELTLVWQIASLKGILPDVYGICKVNLRFTNSASRICATHNDDGPVYKACLFFFIACNLSCSRKRIRRRLTLLSSSKVFAIIFAVFSSILRSKDLYSPLCRSLNVSLFLANTMTILELLA